MSNKNDNGIIVNRNKNNEINIDTTKAINKGINETVIELLKELYSENKKLYEQLILLINNKQNQLELQNFLLLIETIFAKFVFKLEFEENKWMEISESVQRLKKKHTCFNEIISVYVKNVNLEKINPALRKNEVSLVKYQIEKYFN